MTLEIALTSQTKQAFCENCPYVNCTYVPPELVPETASKCKVMFVGEAPGAEEEKQKRPFIGESGQLLRSVFDQLGPKIEPYIITNAVKCRPPANEEPQVKAQTLCRTILFSEIQKYDPDIIVILGNTPLKVLLKRSGITKYVNIPVSVEIEGRNRIVIPAFHPAFILRNGNFLPEFTKSFEILESRLESIERPTLSLDNYEIVNNLENALKMLEYLSTCEYLSFDLETTPHFPFYPNAHIAICGVSDGKRTFTFSSYELGEDVFLEILRTLFSFDAKLVAQNMKFDVLWLKAFGIRPKNLYFDTMIGHFLLNENLPHKLAFILSQYGIIDHKQSFQDMFIGADYEDDTNHIFSEESFWKNKETMYEYNAKDAWSTFVVFEKMTRDPEFTPEFWWYMHHFYIPLIDAISDVELRGIKVDQKKIDKMGEDLKAELVLLKKRMMELPSVQKWIKMHSDKVFNPASADHVREIIYEIEKLPVKSYTSKKKKPSTGTDALLQLQKKHQSQFVELLLTYREKEKILSTFIEGLKKNIMADGLVHPTYNLTGTVTGRFSCKGPNIQQIPKESIIRSFFIPKLDWIVEADYSQLELRVAALLSGDTRLIEVYRKGEDLHYKTASLIFGKPIEEISNEERAVAKAINFGVLYGIGAKGLKETLEELGMEISEQKAEEFIKKFFLSYPELSTWVTDQKSKVKNQGYVQTLFGRKRRLPNDDEESLRQGVNAPVQGTGSDLTQLALLQIHAALKARKLKSHIIATVHDSIILDVADDELLEVLVIIKENAETGVMNLIRQKVPNLREENLVPLKVDISIGKSWGEVEELDDF